MRIYRSHLRLSYGLGSLLGKGESFDFFFEDVASGGLRMQLSEIVAFQMESPYSFPWVLKACDKLLGLASGHTAGRQRKKSEDLT